MMWASSGVVSPRDDFGAWIDNLNTTSWDETEVRVTEKIAELNGRQLAIFGSLARAAGLPPPRALEPGTGFSVMVAGYVAETVRIVFVDQSAQPDHFDEPEVPQFLGPFASTARVAWAAVRQFAPNSSPDDPTTFETFLSVVCDKVVELTSPPVLWRITPEGCSRIAPK
jgi:hypothetical protein